MQVKVVTIIRLPEQKSPEDRAKWNSERKFRRQWKGAARTCIECSEKFDPTQKKQLYCSRKCYRNAVRRKERSDMENGHPWVTCQKCHGFSKLNFSPKVEWEGWVWTRCPSCDQHYVNPVERELAYLEMGKSTPKQGYSKGAKFLGFGRLWNYTTPDDFPKPPAENFNDGGDQYLSD